MYLDGIGIVSDSYQLSLLVSVFILLNQPSEPTAKLCSGLVGGSDRVNLYNTVEIMYIPKCLRDYFCTNEGICQLSAGMALSSLQVCGNRKHSFILACP